MSLSSVKVGILGASGYSGAELLRLLADHPQAELVAAASQQYAGQTVGKIHPVLRGTVSDVLLQAPDDINWSICDLIFTATPSGVAMTLVPEMLDSGVRIIDLSADFRLQDAELWQYTYGQQHACPDLLPTATYGLPEINRAAIQSAQLVANPGCYPTAICLGLLPLIKHQLISLDDIVADAKSGVSGAGRHAAVDHLFAEVSENFRAYSATAHRHHPEIVQTLKSISAQAIQLTFVPHLVPMTRGIHATLYAPPFGEATLQSVQACIEEFYVNEPFVDVLPMASHPRTDSVQSTNLCRLAVHQSASSGCLVVLSVIDNLTKGAAGQAIQNMNIMFGLKETTGLSQSN